MDKPLPSEEILTTVDYIILGHPQEAVISAVLSASGHLPGDAVAAKVILMICDAPGRIGSSGGRWRSRSPSGSVGVR
ncbi:MAG: hypothetical protein J7L98_00775 [Candidatus Verstraetearchaeota archaeon]|nr:hypothetical protein [Candidatus Verstraetearchaeota archaeon]